MARFPLADPFPLPRSSYRTCGFPASGFRTKVISCFWHATFLVVSRACRQVVGSRQSPLLPHWLRCLGTEAPLLGARYAPLHYYEPLRHPRRPGLSLAGFLFEPYRSACRGFPCSYTTPLFPCLHHYPGEPAHFYRRSLCPLTPGLGLVRCALAAFPLSQRCRPSHCPFRGLLG